MDFLEFGQFSQISDYNVVGMFVKTANEWVCILLNICESLWLFAIDSENNVSKWKLVTVLDYIAIK